MSYTATHAGRLKDLKSLGSKVKTITDDHEARIAALEELATALLGVTNSVIWNIERND
ncbi:MAG: hypothetical protein IJS42_05285 [Synergistaceae bacterium]|nr:hypothetical protein [Synergistaceae bacterium]